MCRGIVRLSGGVNERWPGDKGGFDRGPARSGSAHAAIADRLADFQSISWPVLSRVQT